MQDYLINNWQPLILVLLAFIAGSIVLIVWEKFVKLLNPKLKKFLIRLLFYVVFLSAISRILELW